MSENSTRQITLEELISSREASLVNHFPQAEKDLGPKTNATCGQKCLESFGRFPLVTSWGKTFAGYLIGQGDWYSKRCALTWKMKATKSHRIYFQLQVSALAPTEGIEFGLLQEGLLPTPRLNDYKGGTSKERTDGVSRRSELNHLVSQEVGKSSQLNPLFVEEMMGFPENWTALPFQSGEKKV